MVYWSSSVCGGSVECVLQQHQHLLPHPAVLVTEGRLDLLEERLGRDGGVHQLAQHDVGLLPHLRPGVAQPVLDGAQDGVEVGLELGGQAVDDEPDDVQTILRHLQSRFLVLAGLLIIKLGESFHCSND